MWLGDSLFFLSFVWFETKREGGEGQVSEDVKSSEEVKRVGRESRTNRTRKYRSLIG